MRSVGGGPLNESDGVGFGLQLLEGLKSQTWNLLQGQHKHTENNCSKKYVRGFDRFFRVWSCTVHTVEYYSLSCCFVGKLWGSANTVSAFVEIIIIIFCFRIGVLLPG